MANELPTWDEMSSVSIRTLVDAKEYAGKIIFYLTDNDVDHSGRGYYFVRSMFVARVISKEFVDSRGNYVAYRNIIRIKVKEQEAVVC